ncbi:Uncharacterised protein [Moraxella lacunata]|uniref:Uncharacterized protein n=2 Tax=Moraxella lacunata TaxID=477 RepID=A0A1V4GLT9_MORLA|nr:hypothetical protein [Moraxella lacunata]OPH33565.1 hypothetical protein B5J94_12935 [Moraxella lacunata]STZ00411.1 Uncharacterised protein [Moraxella lacunata]
MQTQPITSINQAVNYIQSLPISMQQEMIDWIATFQHTKEQAVIQKNELSELQKSFLEYEKFHQKMIGEFDDDEMSDDDYDKFLASLRDKNDIGREVSFE